MLKKTIMIGALGAAALATACVFGYGSYIETAVDQSMQSSRENVPIEFELKRIRKLIDKVAPELASIRRSIAKDEVARKQLKEEAAALENRQKERLEGMKTLRDALDSGREASYFCGRRYNNDEIRADLERRVETYKQSDIELKTKLKLISARERMLSAAKKRLTKAHERWRMLEVKRQNLRARLATLQTMKKVNTVKIDESSLSEAEQALTRLADRLEVGEKEMEFGPELDGEIPLKSPEKRDVVSEVDTLLQRY